MKLNIITAMLITCLSAGCLAQGINLKPKIYHSWFYLYSKGRQPLHVYTFQFSDSAVSYIQRDKYTYGITPKKEDIQSIPVPDINKIYFRNTGTKTAAVITCAVVGMLTGVIIGINTKHHYHDILQEQINTAETVFPIFLGTGIGIGIGFALGSIKKQVRIGGDYDTYLNHRPNIEKYSIKYYIPD